MTDPISDFLTRIRNAVKAQHRVVDIPISKIKKAMTEILYAQGYILSYKFEQEESRTQGLIRIALKYDALSGQPAINDLHRVSSPGLRRYSSSEQLPRVKNGLGIAIISTSQGLMTDKDARRANTGGEVLCFVS